MTPKEIKEIKDLTARLRHAYENLVNGCVIEANHKMFADGLIAPVIRCLEVLTNEQVSVEEK